MKDLLKLIVCWFVFVVSVVATGFVNGALNLQSVRMPSSSPPAVQLAAQLCGGALLVFGLYPLARGLAASFVMRSLALGSFLFLALGVNGTVEVKAFTNLLAVGAASTTVFYGILALLVGTALGACFGSREAHAGLPHRGWPAWCGRAAVAWLAWPVIYFLFGACIAPIVVPYYRAGVPGLHIPPLNTILTVQLFRGLVFLACSLPFVALWKGSRRALWLGLGLAHAFVVGIYGLASATFLPWVLRVTHSIEISADSFAYAGLLVLLFTAPAKSRAALPGESPQLKPCPSK
jgi:hypothetical protein